MEMKNITMPEINKLKDYFTQLAELQIHRFGPGKVILHFDKDKQTGNTFLMEIEVQHTAWKRKKVIHT